MLRLLAIGFVAWFSTGCLFDQSVGNRPARFYAGPNARDIVVPITQEPGGGAATTFAGSTAEPEKVDTRLAAYTASFQFTMASKRMFYLGGEAEAGRLEAAGSNFAGAYGIVGAEHRNGFGSIGAELAGGWRGLRFTLNDDDHNRFLIEPRVRGQMWIADQFTLGAAAGAVLDGHGEWMAGFYIGVHSHDRTF